MSPARDGGDNAPIRARMDSLLLRRSTATATFFGAEAHRIARLCHAMAVRFARGGRLLALGHSPAARSDARHVAVEFVHPVIVGKRALPAIPVTRETGSLAAQIELMAGPDDIVMAFGGDAGTHESAELRDAVAAGQRRGCSTIAFVPVGAEWEFAVPGDDPFVRQELTETLYHVLWELVHVFFEHGGLVHDRTTRPVHDAGASSFLYPFLASQERDLESVLADVRGSVMLKAEEVTALRRETVTGCRAEIIGAAAALRTALDAGGTLLAFGNGGSATDSMDVVADFRAAPQQSRSGWQSWRAIDLTEDASIITAIANDIGTDAIFSRQIIAHARAGDVALALSTSGNSRNIIQALTEARARKLVTIALVGYDGGRIAAEGLADFTIVSQSQHIPRIQEAQACVYHIIRDLVEAPGEQPGERRSGPG